MHAGVKEAILDAVHLLYVKDCSATDAARRLVGLAADATVGAPNHLPAYRRLPARAGAYTRQA